MGGGTANYMLLLYLIKSNYDKRAKHFSEKSKILLKRLI